MRLVPADDDGAWRLVGPGRCQRPVLLVAKRVQAAGQQIARCQIGLNSVGADRFHLDNGSFEEMRWTKKSLANHLSLTIPHYNPRKRPKALNAGGFATALTHSVMNFTKT